MVTPLNPIDQSFGQLVNNGYKLVTIDGRGVAWLDDGKGGIVFCRLMGDPAVEIRSICREVGE